jgi:hypothetical protein
MKCWGADDANCQLPAILRLWNRNGGALKSNEIDHLIIELQTLRRKLQTDGERIERDIEQHAALNEGDEIDEDCLRGHKATPNASLTGPRLQIAE